MGGQGSQHNKPHKSGRRGKSARDKHKDSKSAPAHPGTKAGMRAGGKAERLNATRQQRDRKRAALLATRRAGADAPPLLVAVLPLSPIVDLRRFWAALLAACTDDGADGEQGDVTLARLELAAPGGGANAPLRPVTIAMRGRRGARFTLLPPPAMLTGGTEGGTDAQPAALQALDVGRAAEAVLLVVSGAEGAEVVSPAAIEALAVLRALGAPYTLALVQLPAGVAMAGSKPGAALRERAAAKKRVATALSRQLPGDLRLLPADTAEDARAALRALCDAAPLPPRWRCDRPQLVVQGAEWQAEAGGVEGQLLLSGYVRSRGLSVNQPLHLPGAGDFHLAAIEGPPEPQPGQLQAGGAVAAAALDPVSGAPQQLPVPVLAAADPTLQEALGSREAPAPEAPMGEQTWPTEEELAEAEAEVEAAKARKRRARRLPAGTSDYQAAWILDDDPQLQSDQGGEGGASGSSGSDCESGPRAMTLEAGGAARPSFESDVDEGGPWVDAGDASTDDDMEWGGGDAADEREVRERRRREADDRQFPDEVDVPEGVAARERFARYRGLRSWRASPWDPKEGLPTEYARIWAFERPRRAAKRAKEAAARVGIAGGPPGCVPLGTYVRLRLMGVPEATAAAVMARVAASLQGVGGAPVTAFGLLRHEARLSVLHLQLARCAVATGNTGNTSVDPPEPLPNKERLLLCTGVRAFWARPVLSSDEPGLDKQRAERFLHEGSPCVASVYAPISYPGLPALAFRPQPAPAADGDGGGPVGAPWLALVATGAMRGADPDRVALKRAVLTGYPARVHKSRAVVRGLFGYPDDVRWFRPVDLWTRTGRRGRIREPVGTHGALKAVFDGPVTQQDAVCMTLYKRAFPVWPDRHGAEAFADA